MIRGCLDPGVYHRLPFRVMLYPMIAYRIPRAMPSPRTPSAGGPYIVGVGSVIRIKGVKDHEGGEGFEE